MPRERSADRFQVIDVGGWRPDEQCPVFPVGSRPKRAMFAPSAGLPGVLIPDHRYLFKLSMPRHPVQFWSEVIACEIGALMGVDIPPTFAARDPGRGNVGALIEFFYGRPGHDPGERFVEGVDYLTRMLPH